MAVLRFLWLALCIVLLYYVAALVLAALVFNVFGMFGALVAMIVLAAAAYKFGYHEGRDRGQGEGWQWGMRGEPFFGRRHE